VGRGGLKESDFRCGSQDPQDPDGSNDLWYAVYRCHIVRNVRNVGYCYLHHIASCRYLIDSFDPYWLTIPLDLTVWVNSSFPSSEALSVGAGHQTDDCPGAIRIKYSGLNLIKSQGLWGPAIVDYTMFDVNLAFNDIRWEMVGICPVSFGSVGRRFWSKGDWTFPTTIKTKLSPNFQSYLQKALFSCFRWDAVQARCLWKDLTEAGLWTQRRVTRAVASQCHVVASRVSPFA